MALRANAGLHRGSRPKPARKPLRTATASADGGCDLASPPARLDLFVDVGNWVGHADGVSNSDGAHGKWLRPY